MQKMKQNEVVENLKSVIAIYDRTGINKKFPQRVEALTEAIRCVELLPELVEALAQIQHDIDSAECRDDLDGIKGYIDELLKKSERS